MRPLRNILVPASANSDVIPLDAYTRGSVSVQVESITGTPAITVQWTDDDVFAPGYTAAAGAWKLCGQPGSMAAAGDGGVLTDAQAIPKEICPTAIRFVNGAGSSTAHMSVVQSGIFG